MIDKRKLVDAYGERYYYITDNMDKNAIVGTDDTDKYDLNEMVYEYLDTLSEARLLEITDDVALSEYTEYAKAHKGDFIIK